MEINLLDLMVKIGVDDKATSGVEKVASKVKGAFGAIGRTAAAGAAAAATAVGALGSQALGMYASYEQNVGGIQKLFGNMGKSLEEYAALTGQSTDECAGKWQQLEQAQTTALSNAGNAWQAAGMSANQYMEQVTGFSAALITSLGNDTNAAADYANMAMVDMSDNANTFGTDMQSLQWAYQGFAKQNYTMLDNLKLGYGGTKEEMERLISDANRVKEANGEMADLSIDSFADVTEAIHIIQEQMNIAGTTAREASTTIEGSVNAMKAAWENWLTGLGDDSADMQQLTENLVQSFETAAGNVVPRMAVIIGTLIGQVPGLVSQLGPVAAQAVGDIFAEALRGIYDALPTEAQVAVLDTVGAFLGSIADTASEYLLPALEFLGERFGELFAAVGEAQVWLEPIASFLGEVLVAVLVTLVDAVSAVVAVFTGLIETVTAVVEFFMAAPASIQAFVTSVAGFIGQLPGIVRGFLASVIWTVAGWVGSMVSSAASAGSGFISSVVGFISQLPGNVSGFLSSVIGAVAGWAGQMAAQAAQAASNFGSSLIDGLYGIVGSAMSAGQAIVQGVIDGIAGMIGSAGDAIEGVLSTIASYLPHSPAKRGPFSGKGWTPYSGKAIVQGLAEGIEAAGDTPTEAMEGVMGRVRSAIGEGGARFGGSVSVGASGESVIAWLAANLPAIIADYTPVMGDKDFGRKVRKAVAYA